MPPTCSGPYPRRTHGGNGTILRLALLRSTISFSLYVRVYGGVVQRVRAEEGRDASSGSCSESRNINRNLHGHVAVGKAPEKREITFAGA